MPGTARKVKKFGTESFPCCIYHGKFIASVVNYFLDDKNIENNPGGDIFSVGQKRDTSYLD